MTGREIVKAIMAETGMSNAELADQLHISQAALWDRLNNKRVKSDLGITLLSHMLRLMKYKVIIVPRSTRLPNGGYEIE